MIRDSGLIIPDPVAIRLNPGRLSDWGREQLHLARWQKGLRALRDRDLPPIAGGAGTFSNWFQTTVLGHGTGEDNASWGSLQPVFLALCTVVPDSSKTGSTITEATYTGYARASVPNTSWNAPASGGAGGQSTITNSSSIVFANCTGGSSVIIGWALCTAATVGNVVCWGTATSTTVSTTQTPAQVAASGLTIGLT